MPGLRTPRPGAPHLGSAFIGRQPILDRRLEVYGYELLFRSSLTNQANVQDREIASARVVVDGLLSFGLDELVGDRRAFINAGRAFLVEDMAWQLPPERIVVEILEDVPGDSEVIAAAERLVLAGIPVALDDFVFHEDRVPLLRCATIVKVDISMFDRAGLEAQVEALARYPVELLAERVETADELETARDLGFTFFQGFFFARPTVIEGRRVSVERLAALRVLAILADDDAPLDRLVDALATDVKLSYQVLRIVNSAWYGLASPVHSLREAVLLLGRGRLRAWMSLIALSGTRERSPELLSLALVRAKMCETLGATLSEQAPGVWFTAGLFSTLDLFFGGPLADVFSELPLSKDLVSAILSGTGRLGTALSAVRAFERAEWNQVRCEHLTPGDFTAAYRMALQWAREWQQMGVVAAM